MIEERWKDVVGYEGLYQVSDMGRIKSFLRKGSQITVVQINLVRQLLRNKIKQYNIEKITGLSEATIYRIKYSKNDYREKILKPTIANHGYAVVELKNKGKNQKTLVHRLVLETFVGSCPENMQCCHWDGNPRNNHLSNLRWDTRSGNQQDSIRHGTKYSNFKRGDNINVGTDNPMAILIEDEVRQIKKLKVKFSQRQRADMFGVSPSTIQNIDDGRTWRHVNA